MLGMVDAVCAGIGLGMLLCLLAEHESDLVRLAPPPPELDTRVLTQPDLRRVQRIKALTDHLYEPLSRHPFIVPLRAASRLPT
jgi:DNA-binding transcriptional LysR family regulator